MAPFGLKIEEKKLKNTIVGPRSGDAASDYFNVPATCKGAQTVCLSLMVVPAAHRRDLF